MQDAFLGIFSNYYPWVKLKTKDIFNGINISPDFKAIQSKIWDYYYTTENSFVFRVWFFMTIIVASILAFPLNINNKFHT